MREGSEILRIATPMVLFVDDEETFLEAMERCALHEEWRILTATSGKQALEVLGESPIAVVVSDYHMPEMTGVELLSVVGEQYPNTYRMILSGYSEAHIVMEAINKGHAARFLAKPCNPKELLEAVKDGIRHYMLETENELLLETVKARNSELSQLNRQLQEANELLEDKVRERTATLEAQNRGLVFSNKVLRRLPHVLYDVDTRRRLRVVNEAAMTFSGNTSSPKIGERADGVLPSELISLMDEAMRENRPCFCEVDGHTAHCVPFGEEPLRGAIIIVYNS